MQRDRAIRILMAAPAAWLLAGCRETPTTAPDHPGQREIQSLIKRGVAIRDRILSDEAVTPQAMLEIEALSRDIDVWQAKWNWDDPPVRTGLAFEDIPEETRATGALLAAPKQQPDNPDDCRFCFPYEADCNLYLPREVRVCGSYDLGDGWTIGPACVYTCVQWCNIFDW